MSFTFLYGKTNDIKSVLIIGDSMAQGLSPKFSELLSEKHIQCFSEYKVGTDSRYWEKQDIPTLISEKKPDHIYIALGTNEYKKMSVLSTLKIVETLKDSNVSYTWILPFNKDAQKYNERLIRFVGIENVYETKEQLTLYDGVHPTPRSFGKWAKNILDKTEFNK
jgi:lysophospholipase L1-like esterase